MDESMKQEDISLGKEKADYYWDLYKKYEEEALRFYSRNSMRYNYFGNEAIYISNTCKLLRDFHINMDCKGIKEQEDNLLRQQERYKEIQEIPEFNFYNDARFKRYRQELEKEGRISPCLEDGF